MISVGLLAAIWLTMCSEVSCTILNVDNKQILTFMNELRRQVASGEFVGLSDQVYPPGNNMRQLRWNAGLANHAGAKYAYACRDTGDNEDGLRLYDRPNVRDQNTIVGVYHYSQGAGKDWSAKQIVQSFLDRWSSAGARHVYSGCVIKNPRDAQLHRDIIRFIQMIWGESSQVGCALKACPLKYTFACAFEVGGAKIMDCKNAGFMSPRCEDYRTYGNQAICMESPYVNSSNPRSDAFNNKGGANSKKSNIVGADRKGKALTDCSNPTVNFFRFATEACNLLASYNPGTEPIDYQEFADLMKKLCSAKNLGTAQSDQITDIEILRKNFCNVVSKPAYSKCSASAKQQDGFNVWEEHCATLG